eukprot:364289-Chlamydomonas_euryale.AAC.11
MKVVWFGKGNVPGRVYVTPETPAPIRKDVPPNVTLGVNTIRVRAEPYIDTGALKNNRQRARRSAREAGAAAASTWRVSDVYYRAPLPAALSEACATLATTKHAVFHDVYTQSFQSPTTLLSNIWRTSLRYRNWRGAARPADLTGVVGLNEVGMLVARRAVPAIPTGQLLTLTSWPTEHVATAAPPGATSGAARPPGPPSRPGPAVRRADLSNLRAQRRHIGWRKGSVSDAQERGGGDRGGVAATSTRRARLRCERPGSELPRACQADAHPLSPSSTPSRRACMVFCLVVQHLWRSLCDSAQPAG